MHPSDRILTDQPALIHDLNALHRASALRISLRERKRAMLTKPWHTRADIHSYDRLSARERGFISIMHTSLARALDTLHEQSALLDHPDTRMSHDTASTLNTLRSLTTTLTRAYRDWASFLDQTDLRLDKQLYLSARSRPEHARSLLLRNQLREYTAELAHASRIDKHPMLMRRIPTIPLTGTLRAIMPSPFPPHEPLDPRTVLEEHPSLPDTERATLLAICTITALAHGTLALHTYRESLTASLLERLPSFRPAPIPDTHGYTP